MKNYLMLASASLLFIAACDQQTAQTDRAEASSSTSELPKDAWLADFAAMQRGLVADRDLVPDHQGMTARVVVAGVGDVQHRVILNV